MDSSISILNFSPYNLNVDIHNVALLLDSSTFCALPLLCPAHSRTSLLCHRLALPYGASPGLAFATHHNSLPSLPFHRSVSLFCSLPLPCFLSPFRTQPRFAFAYMRFYILCISVTMLCPTVQLPAISSRRFACLHFAIP